MEALRRLCVDAGIELEYVRLTNSGRILGWYFRAWDGQPVIALDKDLPRYPRLERCILAEEFAHHETGATGSLIYRISDDRYQSHQIDRARDETRALRRAAEILIPTNELADAILSGCTSIDDLANRFYVVPDMVKRRLFFLRQDLRRVQGLRVLGINDLFSPVLVENHWGLEGLEGSGRVAVTSS